MKIPFFPLAVLIAAAAPAAARFKHSRASVDDTADESSEQSPLDGLLIGSGIEVWPSSDATELWFPYSIEYGFTDELLLVIDHAFVSIDPKSPDVVRADGFDDLYTTLDYEFHEESGTSPSLALEAGIKWPTASNHELGEPGHDYTFGILAYKDLDFVELELNCYYTFVGKQGEDNELAVSLWAEVGLTDELALNIALSSGSYGGFSQGTGFEVSLGLAWYVSENLKLEQGVVLQDGGDPVLVFAWEWSFDSD